MERHVYLPTIVSLTIQLHLYVNLVVHSEKSKPCHDIAKQKIEIFDIHVCIYSKLCWQYWSDSFQATSINLNLFILQIICAHTKGVNVIRVLFFSIFRKITDC